MMGVGERTSGGWACRAGAVTAVATSFVTLWTTVVRDDGNGIGFFMVVFAAAIGAFAAGFRAAGMARAMLGVAIMQVLQGVALATAPSIEAVPGDAFKFLGASAALAALWLVSAALFRVAARSSQRVTAASRAASGRGSRGS